MQQLCSCLYESNMNAFVKTQNIESNVTFVPESVLYFYYNFVFKNFPNELIYYFSCIVG
jgi:hypothetical protein